MLNILTLLEPKGVEDIKEASFEDRDCSDWRAISS